MQVKACAQQASPYTRHGLRAQGVGAEACGGEQALAHKLLCQPIAAHATRAGTTVTSAMDCTRKAWVQEHVGGGGSNDKAVQGTLMHELVQYALAVAAEGPLTRQHLVEHVSVCGCVIRCLVQTRAYWVFGVDACVGVFGADACVCVTGVHFEKHARLQTNVIPLWGKARV